MLERMACCGVRELNGISDYRTSYGVLQEVCNDIFCGDDSINFAFIIFTDTSDSTSGRKLCKYIRTNKLGEVIESKCGFNPSSGNNIRVYVWRINKKNLTKWWNKHKLPDDDL